MLAIALIGLLVGFMLGLTGAGGGVLAVPLIALFMGMDIHAAITMSLLAVGAISLVGVLVYARRGEMQWPQAIPVSIAALLGAPIGTFIGHLVNDLVLSGLFIALSLVTVVAMFRGGCHANALAEKLVDPMDCAVPQRGQMRLLAVAFATGILAGCLGVGGGFVLVPALHFFARLSMAAAARISLLAIVAASASALLSRVLHHEDLPLLSGLFMAAMGAWGLMHGQHLALGLRPCRLKEIFASALLIILVVMGAQTVLSLGVSS